jgi:hypothetical protein
MRYTDRLWIVHGYDKHELELFVKVYEGKPCPKAYGREYFGEKWLKHSSDPDVITERQDSWQIDVPYDGDDHGAVIKCRRLTSIEQPPKSQKGELVDVLYQLKGNLDMLRDGAEKGEGDESDDFWVDMHEMSKKAVKLAEDLSED